MEKFKVYRITDDEFKDYGQTLKGYDFCAMFDKLEKLSVPDTGIVYEASVKELEECNEKKVLQNRGFGGMPIQIGYVGGNNKSLNCLEYHKSSEFNITLEDIILVLGKQSDIVNGKFDTSLCKVFLVPAGTGIELYGTTLHYAPFCVGEKPYRVICVLPLGTNMDMPELVTVNSEDNMCAGSNKWLMTYENTKDAQDGKYVGLLGKNITIDMLEI